MFTEDLNRVQVKRIMERLFPDGFTIVLAEGHYNGKFEWSLILEVSVRESDIISAREHASVACREIRFLNHQESVLVQFIPCSMEFM
jgi:hypothetical protein